MIRRAETDSSLRILEPAVRRSRLRRCSASNAQPRRNLTAAIASAQAWAIYYRCDACGHVWAYDKEDITEPPRDVTMRVAEKTVVGAIG